MKCRNLNNGKRNPRIDVKFSGHANFTENVDGSVVRRDDFPPSVHISVGAQFGLYRIGFHMDLKSANGLLEELAKAILDASKDHTRGPTPRSAYRSYQPDAMSSDCHS